MTRHLLVAGAQRSGTTWLHRCLAEHPQVAMAEPARPEPKVFCDDAVLRRGRQWYVDTFFGHACGATVLGEKSTSYLECPGAPDRAGRVLGDPLVLVQLRDPVERAVSNWKFSRDHGLEDRPAAVALAANLEGPREWDRDRFSVSPFAYLERGRYAAQLRPWLDRFGADVRVQFFEEQQAAAFVELFEWLGVDPSVRPASLHQVVNQSESASAELDPGIDAGLRRRLRGYFTESDRELEQLLGRPVPWREEV